MVSEVSPSSGASDWPADVQIAGSTVVEPDPMILNAIGLNYAFEAAVADLVDNSIDAGASNVLIRYIRNGPRLVSICIVDDGCGMSENQLRAAMALGKRRDYGPNELGHFGLGLKAASLGQARSLTVVSRAADSPPCGMRWSKDNLDQGFVCDIVDQNYAEILLSQPWFQAELGSGTVVRLDGVMAFPGALDAEITNNYLEKAVPRLRNHLGLVFHKLLVTRPLTITIDQEEAAVGETGLRQQVIPIDPFKYQSSGRPDYPRTLPVRLDSGTVELCCHMWPPRSQLAAFRIPYSDSPDQGQGFYFYRHDRLLQAGGWNGVLHPEPSLQLARIAVDVDEHLEAHLTMNPEKTRIQASAAFIQAVESAGSETFDLRTFREDSIRRFKEARKPAGTRRRVVPPGRGFAPAVRRSIGEELQFVEGSEPIHIRWSDFEDDSFFEIDLEERTIWLNRQYRSAVMGDRGTSLNDAPLLKAALYLLLNDLFSGDFLGAKEKDDVKLWGAVLATAARVEAQ